MDLSNQMPSWVSLELQALLGLPKILTLEPFRDLPLEGGAPPRLLTKIRAPEVPLKLEPIEGSPKVHPFEESSKLGLNSELFQGPVIPLGDPSNSDIS